MNSSVQRQKGLTNNLIHTQLDPFASKPTNYTRIGKVNIASISPTRNVVSREAQGFNWQSFLHTVRSFCLSTDDVL